VPQAATLLIAEIGTAGTRTLVRIQCASRFDALSEVRAG
jgi:hypothetical protein